MLMHPVTAAERLPIRPVPYPYKAMFAICSDLDETPDFPLYFETLRYLNSNGDTKFGPGLGLEVANSIYFDMPPGQVSYWNATDRQRATLRTLIKSGHIDCLHSFGDLATTRADAARALEELSRHECRLQVWVDHAVAPSNFGADIMRGSGDLAGSPVYHADLTCSFGIRYVWRGRVTSRISLEGSGGGTAAWTVTHPVVSFTTLAKEQAKRALGALGGRKYAMHATNRLLRHTRLRSDHRVVEFIRSNPYWGGVGNATTAEGIGEVFDERTLRQLPTAGGASVLYTHLGKVRSTAHPFSARTNRALARVAELHRAGEVLVTTTARLLKYWHMRQDVTAIRTHDEAGERIEITSARPGCALDAAPSDLMGLTVYVSNATTARLFVDGRESGPVARNRADDTGRPSLSIPWSRLPWPGIEEAQ
jgi:hypothetical protein